MKKIPMMLLCGVLLTACSDSQPAQTHGGQPSTPEAPTPTPAPTPEPEPPPPAKQAPLVEFDLSTADAEWQGWIAKAPGQAKVMADGVKGARVAGGGRDGFDLAWAPRHKDLAKLKQNLMTKAANSEGNVKINIVAETEDHLEWMSEAYGSKTWDFATNFAVGDKQVSCGTNFMMGLTSEEALEQHKNTCKTLARREE